MTRSTRLSAIREPLSGLDERPLGRAAGAAARCEPSAVRAARWPSVHPSLALWLFDRLPRPWQWTACQPGAAATRLPEERGHLLDCVVAGWFERPHRSLLW